MLLSLDSYFFVFLQMEEEEENVKEITRQALSSNEQTPFSMAMVKADRN